MNTSVDDVTISAVIPSCDRPHAVWDAVASVLKQTVQPEEVIVVDNGKDRVDKDNLPDRVTLLKLEPYAGVSRARNEGARAARNTYVAFLDDDDTWAPDYLEKMQAAIAREQDLSLFTGHKLRVENGKRVGTDNIAQEEGLMPTLLYRNPGVGGSNILARRSCFREVGGFDSNLQNGEDRALALDFIRKGKRVGHVAKAIALVGGGSGDGLNTRNGQLEDRKYFFSKYKHMMSWSVWLKAKMFVLRFEVQEAPTPLARKWAQGRHFLFRILHEMNEWMN